MMKNICTTVHHTGKVASCATRNETVALRCFMGKNRLIPVTGVPNNNDNAENVDRHRWIISIGNIGTGQ